MVNQWCTIREKEYSYEELIDIIVEQEDIIDEYEDKINVLISKLEESE